MSDVLSVHHPPALRVGGRRLSISARSRSHNILGGPASPTSPTTKPDEDTDYPRPVAQGEGDEQAQMQGHPPPHEEEIPKKEKKHGHGGHDHNRLMENVYCKFDATLPSKDHMGGKHSFGGAGRISQPMGRALSV